MILFFKLRVKFKWFSVVTDSMSHLVFNTVRSLKCMCCISKPARMAQAVFVDIICMYRHTEGICADCSSFQCPLCILRHWLRGFSVWELNYGKHTGVFKRPHPYLDFCLSSKVTRWSNVACCHTWLKNKHKKCENFDSKWRHLKIKWL